jgi:hypothetical protein
LFVRFQKTCSTLLYFSNLSPSAKNVFNLVILIFPCTFVFSLHIFRTCLDETTIDCLIIISTHRHWEKKKKNFSFLFQIGTPWKPAQSVYYIVNTLPTCINGACLWSIPFDVFGSKEIRRKRGGGFRIIYMSGHTDRNTAMNNPVWKHTNKPCTIAYLYINIVDGRMTPFYFLNSGSSVGGDPADRIDVVYYTPPNSKKYIKRKPRIYIKWIFSNITCFVRL